MNRVLIVDDEVQVLNGIIALLEDNEHNFEIFSAENGRQAMDHLENGPIDLVLTDLQMPEMDGFELLANIASDYPNIPTIIMTAINTPGIETQLYELGATMVLPKPFLAEELFDQIKKGLSGEHKNNGELSGVTFSNFLQFLAMEQKTCLLEIRNSDIPEQSGVLYLNNGEIHDALMGDCRAEEAVYAMMAWENNKITLREPPKKKIRRRINTGLMSILMEGARRMDEASKSGDDCGVEVSDYDDQFFDYDFPDQFDLENTDDEPGWENDENAVQSMDDEASGDEYTEESVSRVSANETGGEKIEEKEPEIEKGEDTMGQFEAQLSKLQDVDGFMGVGIFSPQGEMVDSISIGGINQAEIGALANDILLKAQKTSEIMGVGRGNLVHIQAPKAHLLIRCLNEATDFAATASGRAHIHMALVIQPEGNLALAKMKLESLIQELAPSFR